MSHEEIAVSAPGRICLFGEHQDYFGLPVIAAAINLRMTVQGTPRRDKIMRIHLPDIAEEKKFSLDIKHHSLKERDYLISTVNVLKKQGIRFPNGWNCCVYGTLPINAGTSSSSALVIAWIKFLLEAVGGETLNSPRQIAELGFLAEVAEFNEPGGKMDHYASSLGGIVSVSFEGQLQAKKLRNPLKSFVLADSLQKKDTTGMLGTIKSHVLRGVELLGKQIKGFSLKNPLSEHVNEKIKKLPPETHRLLKGTLLTRDLTAEGGALFTSHPFNHGKFGKLLTRQQEVLRNYLRTSTPKMDKMIDAALNAGALGAKISGSGGGGCMFAYAPDETENVAKAVEKIGARVTIIQVDEGVRRESYPSLDEAKKRKEK